MTYTLNMVSNASQSIQDLQRAIKEFVDERDWNQFHNPKDLAISLSLEASEVLEHFQWKKPEEIVEHLAANKSEVGHELADVLYWVLLMANNLDIDLERMFIEKLQVNGKKYPIEKAKGRHSKYTEL